MHEKSFNDTSVRDLYPHLNEDQLEEAEENLERYLALVLRIYDRIQNDPQAYSVFKALTASRQKPMMGAERSNFNSPIQT